MTERLPKGWCLAPFERLTENHDGRRVPVKASERAQRQGLYPYYGASGIIDQVDEYLFDGDYLLIAEDGANLLSRSTPIAFQAHGKFWVNNHAHVTKPLFDAPLGYLEAFLNSIDLARYITGTAQPKLTQKALNRIDVPLPPLNEQRRIVAKLDSLQERSRRARESLDAVPALLDKLRQSILAAAFRGDLTRDFREQHKDLEPASKLLQRIRTERRKKWEEAELAKLKAKGKAPTDDKWKAKYKEPDPVDPTGLPTLPDGWCWASADELSNDITVGHVGPMEHRYVSDGVPFLRSQNVRANRYDPTGLRYIPLDFHAELSKSRLSPGDLVVVRSGAPGTACVIPDELTNANCADLVIARLISLVDPHVIAFYMNSAWGTGAVLDAQVGVAQQHFNVGAMRALHMPLMPMSEQCVLRERLTEALLAIAKHERRLSGLSTELDTLDRAILAKAFRGELVPQDPRDEPADELLARVRADQAAPSTPRGRKRAAEAALHD